MKHGLSKKTEMMYYDSKYFEYQKKAGEIGGIYNQKIFRDFIHEDDVVVDFGCGGGYLLKNLNCKRKIGIEINSTAKVVAEENGIEVYTSSSDLPSDFADVIISNHVLEHTECPLNELKGLFRILRKGGEFVIIVPCESIKWKYKRNEPDHHLYTWSPMCIGNLLTAAGFKVIESKPYYDRYISHFRNTIIKFFGLDFYRFLCHIFGLFGPLFNVKVIAVKE